MVHRGLVILRRKASTRCWMSKASQWTVVMVISGVRQLAKETQSAFRPVNFS
jgi:hypothetical protein